MPHEATVAQERAVAAPGEGGRVHRGDHGAQRVEGHRRRLPPALALLGTLAAVGPEDAAGALGVGQARVSADAVCGADRGDRLLDARRGLVEVGEMVDVLGQGGGLGGQRRHTVPVAPRGEAVEPACVGAAGVVRDGLPDALLGAGRQLDARPSVGGDEFGAWRGGRHADHSDPR
nr:hypothetical protein [Streptomyces sp. MK7]